MSAAGAGAIEAAPAIAAKNIVKRFGDFTALDDVSFTACAGEIHALLGENGAGKSTLMNIVSGLYQPDQGTIEVAGQPASIRSPSDAATAGIGMVHQHFKLVPAFSGIDNLALFDSRKRPVNELRQDALALARQGGITVDLDRAVDLLSVAEQQRLEILKVLLGKTSIVILDEPTAVLTDDEGHALMRFARGLARAGAAVVLVTHKLYEALEYCDRITVMRGGRTVAETTPQEVDAASLTDLIVGRRIETERPQVTSDHGPCVLELNGVAAAAPDGKRGLVDATFRLYQGEIYGIAGVSGNGQAELAASITGLLPVQQGEIAFAGRQDVAWEGPRIRRKAGLAVIPADRYRDGLAGELSVTENWAIAGTLRGRFGGWAWFSKARARAATAKAIEHNDIQGVRHLDQRASLLSGGNAQKLVIAREFSEPPRIVVADSPSRGLDVQACAAVHRRLRQARDNGAAVILISDDLDEVMLLSDRIGVLNRGRIVREFAMPAERADIGHAMVGHG